VIPAAADYVKPDPIKNFNLSSLTARISLNNKDNSILNEPFFTLFNSLNYSFLSFILERELKKKIQL